MSDGRLIVFDAQAQHLRVFSPDGTHQETIGGPGSGPGEFAVTAGPVLVGPGDSLYVPDIMNARLNRFTPEAEPLGSTPIDMSGSIPMIWLDTPDGLLINQLRPFAIFPGQTLTDSMDLILARGTDGTVIDTLFRFPSGRTFGQREDGMPEITFFAGEPVWTITSTGKLVYGDSNEYRLGIYEDGQLTRIVERPFSRPPVSAADKVLLKDAMSRVWEDQGMPPEALQVMTDGIGFAETYPAHGVVRGGPEGSIWVQHFQTPSELPEHQRENFDPALGFGSRTWDVFDPDGRFLGELDLPERYMPLRIDGDRIYGVLRDELDVQYVLVLRVHWTETELESGPG